MSSKWKARIVWTVAIVLTVAIGVTIPLVLAQDPLPTTFESPPPGGPEWPPVPDVDVSGLKGFVEAVGIGAVIMTVVEILKRLGLVPDGQAGRWTTIANIVAFSGLVLAGVFGVDYQGDQARAIYDLIYRIGQAILTIISSPVIFKILREAGVMRKMRGRE